MVGALFPSAYLIAILVALILFVSGSPPVTGSASGNGIRRSKRSTEELASDVAERWCEIKRSVAEAKCHASAPLSAGVAVGADS